MTATLPLAPKDYATDQEVRWCPGCGDYAILKAVQKTLSELGVRREQTVFVSGIGCSSRFPYYMSTYGFHTIHGRAPAFATGIKLTNPELDVWMVTGDGDGLSIGGNHLLHLLRRNVNLQVLLFNNEIYGLTKGQASPTSRRGTRSPSTPRGSIDPSLVPATLRSGQGRGSWRGRWTPSRPTWWRCSSGPMPMWAPPSWRSSRTAWSSTTECSTSSPPRTWPLSDSSTSSMASRCCSALSGARAFGSGRAP